MPGEQALVEPFIEECRYIGFVIQVPDCKLERYRTSEHKLLTLK